LRERLTAFPDLTAARLLRELKERGFGGGYSAVKRAVRGLRPATPAGFEHRYETPAGRQAQVDFAYFRTRFADAPDQERVVWLFSMVLGHSRMMWGCFVPHQDLQTVLRCHSDAFGALGGVPAEILYDRMKTAVTGEDDAEGIVYNKKMLDFAAHYGFIPKACRPYRAKTKGKVERPFRYIRQDFFLGRTFRNLEDLNVQFSDWLNGVANARRHTTTHRIVAEHFAEEKPTLKALPAGPYTAVLKLERRISRDGMVSVGGNHYSVPDATRRRAVDVHVLANQVHIFEEGALIASHPLLSGTGQRRISSGHRIAPVPANATTDRQSAAPVAPAGEVVAQRPLSWYDSVGQRLAGAGAAP
jgi:transposase